MDRNKSICDFTSWQHEGAVNEVGQNYNAKHSHPRKTLLGRRESVVNKYYHKTLPRKQKANGERGRKSQKFEVQNC